MDPLGGVLELQKHSISLARSYGDSFYWHWNPGLESLVWAGTPSYSGGTSAFELSLPIFNCHTWVWVQLLQYLWPSCQSWCGFFFISLVVGLPFSSISGSSEWLLLYSLVIILILFRGFEYHVYLYHHLDQNPVPLRTLYTQMTVFKYNFKF